MIPDFTWKFQTVDKIYIHRLNKSLTEKYTNNHQWYKINKSNNGRAYFDQHLDGLQQQFQPTFSPEFLIFYLISLVLCNLLSH